jgi:hypothetical protein
MNKEIRRWIIAMSLSYSLYINLSCPCDPLFDCHAWQFWLSMALTTLLVIIELHIRS